ncbi:hypothetical protein MKL51_06010 [Acinetobacter sp. AOR18_HL]|uniref:hypothetical protein n=1 Tax=Acinetobacter sp. AOR18_HL TaxID=2919381 RepID=UPI0022EB2995|nr:hypothetical protein [Acinetobacter sp. AOR18_HL]MDA3542509.1 hypothetical protein [Acinetobacter sp. AOR18_HL]
MKERPIILNTTMVKAIIEGRKVQTRRLVKEKLISEQAEFECGNRPNVIRSEPSLQYYIDKGCPFGQVGDHLWVRETFCIGSIEEEDHYQGWPKPLYVHQDGDPKQYPIYKEWCLREGISFDDVHWKPSIHMPRSASRILLEITKIRIEKLNQISNQDAVQEGLLKLPASGRYVVSRGDQYFGAASNNPCEVFKWLWESIYGSSSWELNPWVWVIEFNVIQGGEG